MVIYLPCKLGEKFTIQRFSGWVDGKRVYKPDDKERELTGFNALDCNTRCLAIPTLHSVENFVSYDPLGEFLQEYIPKYRIMLDVKTERKLSEMGFPSGKTARLSGLVMENGYLMANFVTSDRYEHLRYIIKDNIEYAELAAEPELTKIEYDEEATRQKVERDRQKSENEAQLRQIRKNVESQNKKKNNIADIIRGKMKRIENEERSYNT